MDLFSREIKKWQDKKKRSVTFTAKGEMKNEREVREKGCFFFL